MPLVPHIFHFLILIHLPIHTKVTRHLLGTSPVLDTMREERGDMHPRMLPMLNS